MNEERTLNTDHFVPNDNEFGSSNLYDWLVRQGVPSDISQQYIEAKDIEADLQAPKTPLAKGSKELLKEGSNATAIKMFDQYLRICGVKGKKSFPPEFIERNRWVFYWEESIMGKLKDLGRLSRMAKAKVSDFRTAPKGIIEELKAIEDKKELAEHVRKKMIIRTLEKFGIPGSVLNMLDVGAVMKKLFELDEIGYSKGLSKHSYLARIPIDPFGTAAFEDAKAWHTKEKTKFKTTIQQLGPKLASAQTIAPNKDMMDTMPPKLKKAIPFKF
jgi:hypothetical protein